MPGITGEVNYEARLRMRKRVKRRSRKRSKKVKIKKKRSRKRTKKEDEEEEELKVEKVMEKNMKRKKLPPPLLLELELPERRHGPALRAAGALSRPWAAPPVGPVRSTRRYPASEGRGAASTPPRMTPS